MFCAFIFINFNDNLIGGCAITIKQSFIVKLIAEKKLPKWLRNICRNKLLCVFLNKNQGMYIKPTAKKKIYMYIYVNIYIYIYLYIFIYLYICVCVCACVCVCVCVCVFKQMPTLNV